MSRQALLPIALLMAMLLAGCAAKEPAPLDQPPQADAETLRREAEERRLAEEEAKRVAEERRRAEQRLQQEEIRREFGPVGQPPPVRPPPEPQPTGIPFDEAIPPLPQEPTLRVAVLGHVSQPDKAGQVALIIGTYERSYLEERLGMAVRIAYVARVKQTPGPDTEIRYRPDFLRAAQSVATVLPAQQRIGPMTDAEQRQEGVDLFVYVGQEYR